MTMPWRWEASGDPRSEIVLPGNPIEITSSGGHIGRLYWANQNQLTVQCWHKDEDPTLPPKDSTTVELPGFCAMIFTIGDWWAWCES